MNSCGRRWPRAIFLLRVEDGEFGASRGPIAGCHGEALPRLACRDKKPHMHAVDAREEICALVAKLAWDSAGLGCGRLTMSWCQVAPSRIIRPA